MGKGHVRLNTRPAAQSHTAHKFNTPKHGKTPQGFSVKPAKPEIVPVYSVTPRVSLNTTTGKILGAVLLLGAAGSLIKGADSQCVNPRPTPINSATNCDDQNLFYGPEVDDQRYKTVTEYERVVNKVAYPVYERVCKDHSLFQWGWEVVCGDVSRTAYRDQYSVISRVQTYLDPLRSIRKVCTSSGQVAGFRGTQEQSAALQSRSIADGGSSFEEACRLEASRCAAKRTYVCETPKPTPTPTRSSSSAITTTLAPAKTSTVAFTSTLAPVSSSTPTISSSTASSTIKSIGQTTEAHATPSPTFNAEDVPVTNPATISDGPDPTGGLIGTIAWAAGAVGVVAGGMTAAHLIKKKRERDAANQFPPVHYSGQTQTAEFVVENPQYEEA